MSVKFAANVIDSYKLRKSSALSTFDLVAPFTQFRRDERKMEARIEGLLGFERPGILDEIP